MSELNPISKTEFTKDDLKHIATQVNAQLDIPWVPEAMEQIWIEWGIGKILGVIPSSIISMLADATDGLTADEISKYETIITDLANGIIDIPVLPETIEFTLIRPIVRQLLQFAAVGNSMSLNAPVILSKVEKTDKAE